MQQVWWIWALSSLVALVLEACLGGSFIFVFFAFGAAVTAAAVGFGLFGPIWQQALCFCAFTGTSLLLLRRPLMAWGQRQLTEHDVNSIIGSAATVRVTIAVNGTGQVLHRGTVWMAQSTAITDLPEGTVCRVVAVNNLTLVVQPEHQEFVS